LIKHWQIETIEYSVVAVALFELILFLTFVVLAIASNRDTPFSKEGIKRLGNVNQAWNMSTRTKARFLNKSSTDAELLHQDDVATFLRARSDALVVGGLGLTAWAVLVTQASNQVGSSALRLLLFGVAVTLVAPCLIRSGPSAGSYLALSALGAIGFIAVLFAVLLGSANYFRIGWYSSVITLLGPLVALTVLLEAKGEGGRLRTLLNP
jgi:hypothetical protein